MTNDIEVQLLSVSEYLGSDHDRLDAFFDETERLAGSGEFMDALARFLDFRRGLERHIDLEEQLLFPAFQRALGTSGPTEVMRVEHREIRVLLDHVEEALRGEMTSELLGAAADLRQVLGDHNVKEEEIVYPETDRALGAEGADRLVRSMRAC